MFKVSAVFNAIKSPIVFATATSQKIESINYIIIDNLKLRPIVDRTGTCYYKTGKVIAKCLYPPTKNEFFTTNSQRFPSMLNKEPLFEEKKDVSYNVESLFANSPIKENFHFICDEICNHKE